MNSGKDCTTPLAPCLWYNMSYIIYRQLICDASSMNIPSLLPCWGLQNALMVLFSFCRLLLPLSVNTLSGLEAPSWPLCPPSNKCGSASKSTMRPGPPLSTASASEAATLHSGRQYCAWNPLRPSPISHQSLYSLFTHVQFVCDSNIYCFINKPD